jgi:hypothetical protein
MASFFHFLRTWTHTARTRGPLALIRGLVRRGDERCRVRSTWNQAKCGCSSLRLNHGSDIRLWVAAVFGAVCLMDCRVQVVVGLLEGDIAFDPASDIRPWFRCGAQRNQDAARSCQDRT